MNNKIYVFDLDGTLALIDHRRHWLDKEQHPELSTDERWRRFFADCVNDEPNLAVIRVLHAIHRGDKGARIIIFSGRSDEVREQTEAWLERNGLTLSYEYDELRMRPAGDFTVDEELKRAWLAEMDKSDIVAVFDDRDKVVSMWRSEGVPCFQVAPGGF
jgi:hypothetical protein